MNPVRSKADKLKWNQDVVLGMAAEYGYEVNQHTETHFSIIHQTKGRLDYWASTGTAIWLNKNGKPVGKSFRIQDIEAYIIKIYGLNETVTESDKQRLDRYENVLKRIANGCDNPIRLANDALNYIKDGN